MCKDALNGLPLVEQRQEVGDGLVETGSAAEVHSVVKNALLVMVW
jgi:hypothetical protein